MEKSPKATKVCVSRLLGNFQLNGWFAFDSSFQIGNGLVDSTGIIEAYDAKHLLKKLWAEKSQEIYSILVPEYLFSFQKIITSFVAIVKPSSWSSEVFICNAAARIVGYGIKSVADIQSWSVNLSVKG